ncbi:unnamed protein product [Phytophthora lilii]|uniref:Unnamed protein product n=1 Tax=Phytophthora lilii TaxID=2077276 RepID=A0A9W6XHC4_9STRA|nr:unnamed protein product [Phytophthora lilii]
MPVTHASHPTQSHTGLLSSYPLRQTQLSRTNVIKNTLTTKYRNDMSGMKDDYEYDAEGDVKMAMTAHF